MQSKSISQSKLVAVFELTKKAHSTMDTEKCADAILTRTSNILGTQLGSIMLVDTKGKELYIKKAKGLDERIANKTRIKIGKGISGFVAKSGKPILVSDIDKDKRFKPYKKKDSARYSTDSFISVPFKMNKRVVGVINVNNKRAKKSFTKNDLDMLSFIAEESTIAIQNALLYEEAKRLANLKLDFISNISHELKNPLSIIRESIAIIHEGILGSVDKKKSEILNIALNNIDRLNRLLNSLLDLAKLEAGKSTLNRTYFDTKSLVTECVDFILPSAKSKGIKVKVSSSVKYSKIWADKDKIAQVVNNLLSNSLKFTKKNGLISVGIGQDNDSLIISVRDTGIGIEKSQLNSIFNKFKQLGSPSAKKEGTGLGLAISKEIVDKHKGKINVGSGYGKGSTFTVMLPRDLRSDRK